PRGTARGRLRRLDRGRAGSRAGACGAVLAGRRRRPREPRVAPRTGPLMRRLRVGLVAAGLVGQAEHAFYLWEDRERFELAALADASATGRAAVGAPYR